MKKHFLFLVLTGVFSLSLQGEEVSNDVDINLANLEEQSKEATTGAERAALGEKIASSKDVNLILASLSTSLSGAVLAECFKSEDNDFEIKLVILILRSDLKAWEWANTNKPQVLSGGMAVDYMGYAKPCIKILQKNFPGEEFLIENFRIKNKRHEFANRLEIALGKKPRINSESPPETDRGNGGSQTSHQKIIQHKISKPNFVEEKTPEPEQKPTRLPWIIAGVLLVGILALLFKIFKSKSRS